MTSADGGVCTDYSDSFTMMTSQDQARLLATIKEVPGGQPLQCGLFGSISGPRTLPLRHGIVAVIDEREDQFGRCHSSRKCDGTARCEYGRAGVKLRPGRRHENLIAHHLFSSG